MEWIPLGQAINEFWNLEKRMPRVQKQTPTTENQIRTSKSESGVSDEGDGGIKINTYGRGKTGKTRLADTFPKPMLLIGTEDGTKSICDFGPRGRRLKKTLSNGLEVYSLLLRGKPTGTDFLRLARAEQFDEAVRLVVSDGYRSATVDQAGGFQDLILKEVLGLDDVPVQKSWGMTDRQTWGIVGQQFKERMAKLLRLADDLGKNIIVIAHERNFGEEATSDVITPTVGAALTPSVAGWLNGACDYICQTYIRDQVKQTPVEINGKPTGEFVSERTGRQEFCLRVGTHPVYLTGFRVPPGVEIPDSIVNPTYDKIVALIRGGKV